MTTETHKIRATEQVLDEVFAYRGRLLKRLNEDRPPQMSEEECVAGYLSANLVPRDGSFILEVSRDDKLPNRREKYLEAAAMFILKLQRM